MIGDEVIELRNGVRMPLYIQGVPLLFAYKDRSLEQFQSIIQLSLDNGIRAFDTSHDYGKSEGYLGESLQSIFKQGKYKREDVFITTKIGNSQQLVGDINRDVDMALQTLHVDYIDCMLLHWPTPNVWLDNFGKLIKSYEAGKVRSIGIANLRERHLLKLTEVYYDFMPHVSQVELHPFRSVPTFVNMCKKHQVEVQAYSSICQMIPMLRDNAVLNDLAEKYKVSVPTLVLRWHTQKGIAPVFRTYNKEHLLELTNVSCFSLSNDDLCKIDKLNTDYKLHPESMNCPGY